MISGAKASAERVASANTTQNRTLAVDTLDPICLEYYFLPCGLERQVEAFVGHYDHRRYHKRLKIPLADAYFGSGKQHRTTRLIKRQTI